MVSELHVSHGAGGTARTLLDFRFAPAPTESAARADAPPQEGVPPPLWVPLEPLEGAGEAWVTEAPVQWGRSGCFEVRQSGDLLALTATRQVPARGIEAETRRLYLDGLTAVVEAGFPHLIRIWNYVPDINAGGGEQETYKRFCAGRAAALARLDRDPGGLPAASALGSRAGMPLQVTILAGRVPARHLENPRQVSAHRYPPEYGQAPPAFARATLYGRRLLISGTAAIVGHRSQHPGDVERQVRCTADNLLLLMDHACAEADARRVEDLHARVYLRRPEDLPVVRDALWADLPELGSAVFLQADICRRELLVEVEACGVLRERGVGRI
jgi:enamine deaminase RidA (YjgF/YER057c/UK114 family)